MQLNDARAIARRRTLSLSVALGLGLCLSIAGASAQPLPVPAAGLPGFITGMKEVPDPGLDYRLLFDLQTASPAATDVDPRLLNISRYLNSLAEYGVQPVHRHLVVLVHAGAVPLVVNDAAYAVQTHAGRNPNAALIHRMVAAGVQFRVCGQGLLSHHLGPAQLLPGVEMDLWALSTLANLQLHGYAHIGL